MSISKIKKLLLVITTQLGFANVFAAKSIPFYSVTLNNNSLYDYCKTSAIINGKKTILTIDTAADFSLTTSPITESNNYIHYKSYRLYNNYYDLIAYKPLNFLINDEDFSDCTFVAEFPNEIKKQWKLDEQDYGILGLDALKNKNSIFKISSLKNQIEFSNNFDKSTYSKCKIIYRENKCFIEIKANNSNLLALIDTGFDGTIAFPKTLKNNKKYINFSILENDSTVIEKSALIIRNLNVLDIKEDSPLVYLCSPFDNTNFALIGKSFLKNYELIFDFIENFLYYKRNSNFCVYDFDSRKKTCGISQIRFNTEGDLVVSKIFENTTAANKHIKINQKIYSINGILADDIYKDILLGNYEKLNLLKEILDTNDILKFTVYLDNNELKAVILRKKFL